MAQENSINLTPNPEAIYKKQRTDKSGYLKLKKIMFGKNITYEIKKKLLQHFTKNSLSLIHEEHLQIYKKVINNSLEKWAKNKICHSEKIKQLLNVREAVQSSSSKIFRLNLQRGNIFQLTMTEKFGITRILQ